MSAEGPFYVWVDGSCDNVTNDLTQALAWAEGFRAEGRSDVYIADADNDVVFHP